jgi:hypothetical protein
MGIVARFGLRQPEYCATAISAAFTRPYLLLGHRAQGCVPTASQVRRAAARTIAPHQHPHGSSTLTAPPHAEGTWCLGHGGGGHTSWHCRTCDAVVYGPPLNTHCSALEGPAVVRISTSRES